MAASPRLLLDTSVLIAAAGSATGGSARLLDLCRANETPLLLTRLVLLEAEHNIQNKLDEAALLRFYLLIADLDLHIIPTPSSEELSEAAEVVAAKDAHVLAGARTGKATHLITLDRKHFLRAKQKDGILPIVAWTPGEFLEKL
jgi:predicted nucleic acid-binding protein